jgi:hypothetical protein
VEVPPARERDAPAASFRYYLGPEGDWIRIDSEELVIRFGADGARLKPREKPDKRPKWRRRALVDSEKW